MNIAISIVHFVATDIANQEIKKALGALCHDAYNVCNGPPSVFLTG